MTEPSANQNRRWGGSRAIVGKFSSAVPWPDVLVALAVAGMLLAVIAVAKEFGKGRPLPTAPSPIRLELPYLFLYTLYSLARGLLAYCFSLTFAIVYGYWAAKDKIAEKLLLPLLDILQSIPVLAFMPGLMFALVRLFPESEIGLNLASVLLIFTGQVWNMVFSFYHSMKTVPPELYEAGEVYRFGLWRRFTRIELPFSAPNLIWNSMMSMAGGWFFLTVCEAFELGEGGAFQLQGLGSYIKVAQEAGNYWATFAAMVAMVTMIVLMNQLLWRPLTVWAQRFKTEDVAAAHTEESYFLDLLRRSHLLWLGHRVLIEPLQTVLDRWDLRQSERQIEHGGSSGRWWGALLNAGLWTGLLGLAGWGIFLLGRLLMQVDAAQWQLLGAATVLTLLRVFAAVGLGTLWMVPLGVIIGLRPKLAGRLQPVIQVAASFPAPMLFALFLLMFDRLGVPLGWGSILLMTAGTQWYILFNVLGGAMAIPSDLHEAAAVYRWSNYEKWRFLYLPAVFPFLITGWITAAGGAWNTSIVAEYWQVAAAKEDAATMAPPLEPHGWEKVLFDGKAPQDPRVRRAFGLGAIVNRATEDAKFGLLAAAALVMAGTVVLVNRLLWRRLELIAEKRFSMSR